MYDPGYISQPAGYQAPLGRYPDPPPPVYQQQPPYWGQPQDQYPTYHQPGKVNGAPQKY